MIRIKMDICHRKLYTDHIARAFHINTEIPIASQFMWQHAAIIGAIPAARFYFIYYLAIL